MLLEVVRMFWSGGVLFLPCVAFGYRMQVWEAQATDLSERVTAMATLARSHMVATNARLMKQVGG